MYKKTNLPEVNSLVICTIERVQQHECFVSLDEFKKIEGMVHTSEMYRKWVRNMKVFMKPGRQLVCKVISVYNNQVNLSIRKVGEGQRRSKLQSWKNEKRADDLLQFVAKKNKTDIEDLYKKFDEELINEYGGLYPFMLEVVRIGEEILSELHINNPLAKDLFEVIKQRIKIPKAIIHGELHMHSNRGDGIQIIKKAEQEIQNLAKKSDFEIKIVYLGAPKYQITISTENKKKAEQATEDIVSKLQSLLGGKENVEFVRIRS